uniref:Uncharacterized protein n=1 Tax=viral metagenome TaxID=1070528 RepID=A0A6C0CPR2_9ZZZZ
MNILKMFSNNTKQVSNVAFVLFFLYLSCVAINNRMRAVGIMFLFAMILSQFMKSTIIIICSSILMTEIILYFFRFEGFNTTQEDIDNKLAVSKASYEGVIDEKDSKIADKQKKIQSLKSELNALGNTFNILNNKNDRAMSEIRRKREKIRRLRTNKRKLNNKRKLINKLSNIQ